MPKKLENVVKEEKTKKITAKTGKATETKKNETTKKADAKKVEMKKTTTKKNVEKKTGTKSDIVKKSTTKTAVKRATTRTKAAIKVVKDKVTKAEIKSIEVKKTEFLQEYYDLPYRYNETVVKILAQTPKRLFVYWDISDADRERYKRAFGEDFFEKTYPVLLVHNEDKNYTSEIVVNDFANSWYIDIQDPKTRYTIQLGRKFRELPQHLDVSKLAEANIVLKTNYMEVCESNNLEAPNDHVLFNVTKIVRFRNVKTYEERNKDLSKLLTQYGKIYNIKDFYKKMYKEEIADGTFNLRNPSSGGWPSSSSTAF